MIKKVFILALLVVVLFGMSAPVLAFLMQQDETCGMACCSYDHEDMPMVHLARSHHQMQQPAESGDQPCPLMGSCSPRDIPEGFEVESGVPVVKSKVKAYVSGSLLNPDLHENFKSEILSHPALLFAHHPFLSSRDVLTKNSILII